MSEKMFLKTKPRTVNPGRKAKVYFCCYPGDFDRLFEPVSNEILSYQPNAVIYYYDPKEGIPDKEELYFTLSEMQLVVVAVTSDFIEKNNSARNVEFRYAVDNHIPVLPLLQEENIGKRFNEICGSLQYLDRNSSKTDVTAVSYEEKLKRYLDSILLSDEMIKKIQKAFDTFVFLSYRKKDREYAKQIMSNIHKADFMRDVAIWYDEFLTPGENFNNEILEYIIKSSLMALVVTPSLNEKSGNRENYIKEKEYPAALQNNKPVLPIEAIETDRETLRERFDGIEDPVKAEDYAELDRRLKKQLFSKGVKQNNAPGHQYLIGLAYLSGIYVEVNKKKALNLVTMAAEAKVPEAVKKLAEIYRNGEGVRRDISTAIKWQSEYVEMLKASYTGKKTLITLKELIENLNILGDYVRQSGQYSHAKEIYNEMSTYGQIFDQSYGRGKTYIASGYHRIGSICYLEGNYIEAREWLEKSLAIDEAVLRATSSTDALNNVGSDYGQLGLICYSEGNLNDAEDYYSRYIQIEEKVVKSTNQLYSILNLIDADINLGGIYLAAHQPQKAREQYEKALNETLNLINSNRKVECRNLLTAIYLNTGKVYYEEGNLTDAKDCFIKSRDIREQLVQDVSTIGNRKILDSIYNSLGITYLKEGNTSDAIAMLEKCISIDSTLMKEIEDYESKTNYIKRCVNLGNIYYEAKDYQNAHKWYHEGLNTVNRLSNGTVNQDDMKMLTASIYCAMGDVCTKEGFYMNAKGFYVKSLAIRKELEEKTHSLNAKEDLAISYYALGVFPGLLTTERKEYLQKYKSVLGYMFSVTKQPKYIERINRTDKMIQIIDEQIAKEGYSEQKESPTTETGKYTDKPKNKEFSSSSAEKYFNEAEEKINGKNEENSVKPIYIVLLFVILIILFIIVF